MTLRQKYYVSGMHCNSCEILIERQFIKFPGVKDVNAYTKKGEVYIDYEGKLPKIQELNATIQPHGYQLHVERPLEEGKKPSLFKVVSLAGALIVGFYLLYRSGLSSAMAVDTTTALPAFVAFGLVAGFSTCAALTGGIVLSMSRQWNALYGQEATTTQRLQPHWLFNLGRLISYGVFGALLGTVGSVLRPSVTFTIVLTLIVSVGMVILGLQMFGVRSLQKWQFRLPKFLTRRLADETKFQGKYMPFLMGAGTFFLPCGFTVTAQSLALLSGDAWRGGMMMFFFALGTLPILLGIGFSSVKFSERKSQAGTFLKVAGALVLFFALFNINAQFNALGWPSFSDLSISRSDAQRETSIDEEVAVDLPPVIMGKQVVKMKANAFGYTPELLYVQPGLPVRWEIEDTGTNGCAGAIVARNLFKGVIQLTPGQTYVKEFNAPTKPGKYKFSCTMGMYQGVFEVIAAS